MRKKLFLNATLNNMVHKLIILVTILGAIHVNCKLKSYDGYTLYQVHPTTEKQAKFLRSFERDEDIEIWSDMIIPGFKADILVAPWKKKEFLIAIKYAGISIEISMKDMKDCSSGTIITDLDGLNMTWDAYYKLDGIHKWIDSLSKKYPGIVEVISAGKSYEGRELKGVKISHSDTQRSVVIEGGIHAREWISPATVTYIINELLTSNDPKLKKIVKKYNFYLFPSINPDGYVYTYTHNRYWRKTRSLGKNCVGADMNRNFPFQWCEKGASSNECKDTYCGKSALSEIESENFATFVQSVGSSLDFYLAFHSFSQVLIIPYCNTTEHLENYDKLHALGLKAMDALSIRYGTKYKVGNLFETIGGLATGSTMDWAKEKFRIPITYAYELRPSRNGCGFSLPTKEILPNCEEVMDSLIVMFNEAKNMGLVE